jgi:hypothetical protein
LSVLDLVLGDQPGTGRAKGVAALALGPLPGALGLEGAFGHVVDDAPAGDMIERLGFRDIFGRLADHHAKFDFPVGLFRTARDQHDRHWVQQWPMVAFMKMIGSGGTVAPVSAAWSE